VLPTASTISPTLLPALTETLFSLPEVALSLPEVEDPSPQVEPVATRSLAVPRDEAKPTATPGLPQLSDARVAEIEKAISGGGSPGGKKGDSAEAVAESASGHLEGDAPVRIPNKPAIPTLPAGESGHVTDTTPKANKNESPGQTLPPEVELRARTIGQSAGQLSAGTAMEIEAPEKPVSGGRKGQTEPEAEPKPTARPRRVKDNPETAPAPKPIKP
jgi:hypothetical protein